MLILENIRKRFGEREVLRGLSLELAPSGITCLLGSSGCGKSTLLRIIAALEQADSGTVYANSEDCALVFQDPRLLPWLTVGENLRLALPGILNSRERQEAVEKALAMVELPASLCRAMPRELSGGMAQRVGVARALLRRPRRHDSRQPAEYAAPAHAGLALPLRDARYFRSLPRSQPHLRHAGRPHRPYLRRNGILFL